MVVSLFAIYSVVAFFCWVATLVVFPCELDYGEGIVIWQAQHVSHLAAAYAPITRYPFIVFHYTPLYQAVSLAISKLTGDLLLAGRLVSSLSSLGICLVIGWLVYRVAPARSSRIAATGGALLGAALPCGLFNMKWAPLMRVDMLGLWLSLGGLSMFILARTTFQRFAACVLLVAAIYTKQSLIAGAVSCLLVAAIMNLRQATKMFLFFVALGGAILAGLSVATHGEVIKHIFLYNVNRFSMLIFLNRVKEDIHETLPVFGLALIAAAIPISYVVSAIFRRDLAPTRRFLLSSRYRFALFVFSVDFIVSGVFSLAAGKSGANFNYFLEWNLSACVFASLLVARLFWSGRSNKISPAVAIAYLLPLLMLGEQVTSSTHSLKVVHSKRNIMIEEAQNAAALEDILKKSPDPVMSEDMTLLYRAGRRVPFEPAIVTELAATHAWDETPLLDMIRNREFSVMVINESNRSRYSPSVWRAVHDSYRPGGTYSLADGDFTLFVPL